MTAEQRIDCALNAALAMGCGTECPPRLAEAMRHAVFPGGGRLRPRLVLSVARACGDDQPELSDTAAAAIELLHCASLVHDDLPGFDAAEWRRGRPTVHSAFGEPLAILCGDALIVLAFDVLARMIPRWPKRVVRLFRLVGAGVGAAGGIVGGQAWESEPSVDLSRYHRAKTGALFEAAIQAGAVSAGADGECWKGVGVLLGEAYQVADDIADVLADPHKLGKPTGRDVHLRRPSVVLRLGIEGATARLNVLLERALAAVPSCSGREALREQFASMTVLHLASRGPKPRSRRRPGRSAARRRET